MDIIVDGGRAGTGVVGFVAHTGHECVPRVLGIWLSGIMFEQVIVVRARLGKGSVSGGVDEIWSRVE